MWLLLTAAIAAPTDTFPWKAPLNLSPDGVQRIHVPAKMHGSGSLSQNNLLLLNADGERVPMAILAGGAAYTRTTAQASTRDTHPVSIRPTGERNRFEITVRGRTQDHLEVRLSKGTYAVTARLLDDETGALVDETLAWRMDGRSFGTLDLPARTGTFRLELLSGDGEKLDPTVVALRQKLTHVPEEVVNLKAVQSGLQENEWARYDLDLGHAYPVTALDLDVTNDLFERKAGVAVLDPHTVPGTLPAQLYPSSTRTIRRMNLAGSTVEDVEVSANTQGRSQLALLIEKGTSLPPLDVISAKGRFDGVHLVVRNPGPGPHTLYAGGNGREGRSDLQYAAAELQRLSGSLVEAGPVTANPTFIPPERRGGLGEPGRPLKTRGYSYERPITGPAGLVRVPLDDTLLEHARPSLQDLRLMNGEGLQIPYVLRADGLSHTWGELPFTREERGDTSILRVSIDKPNVHVGSVSLATSAPVFSRRVRVARAAGPQLETLRAYDWAGDGLPGQLTMMVHQPVGEELLILIDNGDDPPLPIDTIRVDWPGWEMVAVLPEDGATLLYGNRSVVRPSYDFDLLERSLVARVDQVATLGPEKTRLQVPLSWLDKAMLGGGVGVMALGLLGLALLLLRGGPPPSDEEEMEDDPAPEPETPAQDTPDVSQGPDGPPTDVPSQSPPV